MQNTKTIQIGKIKIQLFETHHGYGFFQTSIYIGGISKSSKTKFGKGEVYSTQIELSYCYLDEAVEMLRNVWRGRLKLDEFEHIAYETSKCNGRNNHED